MTSNKIDSLTLMSGSSIPIKQLGIVINQPTLKDISMIGEGIFYRSLSYFMINKNKLGISEDVSEFDIFMHLCTKEKEIQQYVADILILTIDELTSVKFYDGFIIIEAAGHECIIDEPKFLIIKETFKEIFCLNEASEEEFKPVNDIAERIAEKLRKRKEKLAGQKNAPEQAIFSNFISILTIGSNSLSISDCLNLTVFQIYNLIKRFNLHFQYNMQMQALMQGAENIELVEWTKQI